MAEIVGVAAAIGALLLFRHYAARQVARRRGPFVWAFALPMVVGPAPIVWDGLILLARRELLGAVLLVASTALGILELLFFHRLSKAVSAASPEEDLGEVLVGQTADFALVMTVGGLLFAIVGGMALIAWTVFNQGR